MNKRISNIILKKLEAYYGAVTPDLNFKNNYQLTIAVTLSAQTTDKQVNAVTPLLFQKFPDFAALAAADVSIVESIIKSTGFYKNKAKNIVALSKKIFNEFKGRLPQNREQLMQLPGVGRKTANVILSVGFDIAAFAVDTHISRISVRLGYSENRDPLLVENSMTSFIPEEKLSNTHLLFIRHGRDLCKARNPLCENCPILKYCVNPDLKST